MICSFCSFEHIIFCCCSPTCTKAESASKVCGLIYTHEIFIPELHSGAIGTWWIWGVFMDGYGPTMMGALLYLVR